MPQREGIMSVIDVLRERLAGDTLVGLGPEQVRRKAATLKPERVRSLLFEHRDLADRFTADDERARAADRAAAEKRARDVADEGGSATFEYDAAKGEQAKAVAAAVVARRLEFGLPEHCQSAGEVRCAIRGRVTILAAELKRRYETEGEPAELVKLRADIARARAAVWPPTQKVKEARERLRVVGVAAGERDVLAAVAERDAAERKVQELTARLWTDFGLAPDW